MKACGTTGFERASSAIAVLKKLNIGHLSPLEARQQAEWRCDFSPRHFRLIGKGPEDCYAATLLNGVGNLEVERLPEPLNTRKDFGE